MLRFNRILLLLAAVTLFCGAATLSAEPKFLSVSSEVRVEQSGELFTTEIFRLQIPAGAQVRGFTRGFRGASGAFFGEGNSPPKFEVLLVSRRALDNEGATEELLVKPETVPEGVRYRLGTDQVLPPGSYEYVFQYRVKGAVLQNSAEKVEGIFIQFPQTIDLIKERATILVFPPELIEPSSIAAAYTIIEKDGAPTGPPRTVSSTRSETEKNRLGEGKPVVLLDLPNGLDKGQAISLSLKWPSGFVESLPTPPPPPKEQIEDTHK